MDKACYLASKKHYENAQEKYVPVFLDKTYEQYQNKQLIDNNEINIGCVCRLDVDKIETIINLLNNVYKLDTDKKINFHLIGDGTHAKKINFKHYRNKFNLIHTSYMYGNELKEYISKNIDVMFNFGIAALDVAAMKTPVAIPIYNIKRHEIDKYYFLNYSNSYNVGCVEEIANTLNIKTHTIEEILDLIYEQNLKEKIGNKCYDYLIKNHRLENTFKNFAKYIKESTLTIGECLKHPKMKKCVKKYSRYRKNGGAWDEYIKYRRLKLKHKLYKLICDKIKNKKSFNSLDYKTFKHYSKRLTKVGIKVESEALKNYELQKLSDLQKKYSSAKQKLAKNINNGAKIKVGFMVVFDSVFPAKPLFEKMLNDPIFEPFILIIPDISRGEENLFFQMNKTYETLSREFPNYVYKSWDEKTKKFKDFSNKMDIYCTANPYDTMTHKLYRIEKLSKKQLLSIYFNYGYPSVQFSKRVAALDGLSRFWKVYSESEYAMKEYGNSMRNNGKNLVLAGYMKMDELASQKIIQRDRKTVIIAPHHTIEDKFNKSIGLSNFLSYSELFLELPKIYPQIDFIFRPHPLLKVTLEKKSIWGKEATDKYFEEIQQNSNLVYQEGGDYLETFANSDGIIHDCSSFLAEYLYTEKPVCYMLRSEKSIDEYFMENGKRMISTCYQAYNKEDIISFINNVILANNDTLETARKNFVQKELKVNYPNVSDFVLNNIKEEILK